MRGVIKLKFRLMCLSVALVASNASAQDLSQYDFFHRQKVEGLYGNNWYVMLKREDEGIMYFSFLADGKLPYLGTLITACNTSFTDMIVPEVGSEHYVLEDEVITELYRWVCSS